MTHLNDYSTVGYFPLQDWSFEDSNLPLGAKQGMAAARLIAMSGAEGATATEGQAKIGMDSGMGTVGDIHPWLFWQVRDREKRGMGSYAQVFASIAVDADPYYAKSSVQPFRDKEFKPDNRYAELELAWPAGLNRPAKGTILLTMPHTEETEQNPIGLHADPRLLAVHHAGPGECGTLVCDLQPSKTICMDGEEEPGIGGRAARLQTLIKVIPVEPTKNFGDFDEGGPGNVLAINYAKTKQEKTPAYGACWIELDQAAVRPQGPITGVPSSSSMLGKSVSNPPNPVNQQRKTYAKSLQDAKGLRNTFGDMMTGGGAFGTSRLEKSTEDELMPHEYGEFESQLTQEHGTALMAAEAFGPLHGGHKADKHNLHHDRDGNPINSGHITTQAFFYKDQEKDAPLDFSEGGYPACKPQPLCAAVYLSYDSESAHGFRQGETREGKWRWWSETSVVVPGIPRTPGPPTGGPGRTPGPTTGGPGGGGGRGPNPGGGNPSPPPNPARPGGPTTGGKAPGPTTGGPTGPATGGPTGGGAGGPRDRWPRLPKQPPPFWDYETGGKKMPPGSGGSEPTTPSEPGSGSPSGPVTGGPAGGSGGQGSGLCKDPPGARVIPPARNFSNRPLTDQPINFASPWNPSQGSGSAGSVAGGTWEPGNISIQSTTGPMPSGSMLQGGGEFHSGSGLGGPGAGGTRAMDPRADLGRLQGLDPHTRTPSDPPGISQVVGTTGPNQNAHYQLFHPMAEGFAQLSFRPQLWAAGYPNFAHNPQLTQQVIEMDERVRPQVLSVHAFGGMSQASGEFQYKQTPLESRARGGASNGGIIFAPPRFEMEDYYSIGSAQDVDDVTSSHATQSYVAATPGVAFALGKPNPDGTLQTNSVVIRQDSSSATKPLQIQHNAKEVLRAYDDGTDVVVSVGQGGNAALVIPNGTTAQRPATPALGQVRIVTDATAGKDQLEIYDSQTAAWSQLGTGGGGGGGVITNGDYTMDTGKLLGRTSASSGSIEEIVVQDTGGLYMSGGAIGIKSGEQGDLTGAVVGAGFELTVTQTTLAAVRSVTPAADTLAYFTGATTAASTAITSTGRSVIGAASASSARAQIEVSERTTFESVANAGSVTTVALSHGGVTLSTAEPGIPIDRSCKTTQAVTSWLSDNAPTGTWTLTLKKKALADSSYTTAATMTITVA